MTVSRRELAALARATELGLAGLGSTSPNPSVGCVVLDATGSVAGEGATQPPGGPHAEVVALRAAGGRAARGGTAVVTLEPCAHTGRTGPCTQALIDAGVARVVYAAADPDPLARGGAHALLAAGVDVEQTPHPPPYLRPWLVAVRLGRPAVTWKYAATLDGRSAAADGTSRWITGPEARADVHLLRSRVDAVVAGSGTVLADDPQLTARDAAGMPLPRQPLRVVVDRRHRTSDAARVFDSSGPTLRLDGSPHDVVDELHARGARHVLLEGGPTLAGAFVAADLVDEVVGYVAPALLGAGPAALGAAGIATIAGARRLRLVDVTTVGGDLRLTAHRDRES